MMRTRLVRPISLLLLVVYVSSCTRWEVQTVSPQQTFSDPAAIRKGVRVTTLDSVRLVLQEPRLTGDTIAGVLDDAGASSKNTAMIPLQSVRKLEVKQPDDLATLGLIMGSLAAAAGLSLAVLCITFCGLED